LTGSNEHTLDRVRYDRWVLDLRTAPGRCFDVLIHQGRVRAVDLLS
jgi:erythromycin esterase